MSHQAVSQQDEAIPLAQAVREASGKITYTQLWRLIQQGAVAASQPHGPGGHYRISRSEIERLIAPVARGQK